MTTSARTPQYVFAEKRCKYTTFLCRVDVPQSTPTDAFLNLKQLDKPEFNKSPG